MYQGSYELIGSELSMFTVKLEAQLRFQGIPYQWLYKKNSESKAIQQRSGTLFVPLLKTPDGWLVNDTITIGPMLHERFYQAPVIPKNPMQRALCFILEDYYNHWMPRHALHSRWCYPENIEEVGRNFGINMVLGKSIEEELTQEEERQVLGTGKHMQESFGLPACEVQGAGEDQREAMQADFKLMMQLLSDHLKSNNFLLGDRPCLADFALVGTAKAHFLLDPVPRTWLGEYQAMLEEYVARVWDLDQASMSWSDDDHIPDTLLAIMEHMVKNYQVFALSSIQAAAHGKKEFTLNLGHGEFTARSMKRLDKARLHVQDELDRVNAWEIEKLLNTGALDLYEHSAFIES